MDHVQTIKQVLGKVQELSIVLVSQHRQDIPNNLNSLLGKIYKNSDANVRTTKKEEIFKLQGEVKHTETDFYQFP
jgi:hypothetical protein